MIHMTTCTVGALALAATIAGADIVQYDIDRGGYTNNPMFSDISGEDPLREARFEGLADGDALANYTEDGIRVSVDAPAFQWDAPGMDGSGVYYADTGVRSLVEVSLDDFSSFSAIEMQISSGWNSDEIGAEYLWVQVFSDGGETLATELNLDLISGGVLSLASADISSVRIGSYVNATRRDAHDEFFKNAIVLDNIRVSTLEGIQSVPAPGPLALGAMGGLCAARRRRR